MLSVKVTSLFFSGPCIHLPAPLFPLVGTPHPQGSGSLFSNALIPVVAKIKLGLGSESQLSS